MADRPDGLIAATRTLGRHTGNAGCAIEDLLPTEILRAIADGLSAMPDVARPTVMRERSERERWAALVRAATVGPRQAGFVTVAEGGTRALAARLKVGSQSLLARHRKRWTGHDPPLVNCFYGTKTHRHPPLESVQVPLVTDLVLWAAEVRVPAAKGEVGPNLSLVVDAVRRLAMLNSAGTTLDSSRTLQDLIARLDAELEGRR